MLCVPIVSKPIFWKIPFRIFYVDLSWTFHPCEFFPGNLAKDIGAEIDKCLRNAGKCVENIGGAILDTAEDIGKGIESGVKEVVKFFSKWGRRKRVRFITRKVDRKLIVWWMT